MARTKTEANIVVDYALDYVVYSALTYLQNQLGYTRI